MKTKIRAAALFAAPLKGALALSLLCVANWADRKEARASTIDPASWDFGKVVVGSNATKTFRIPPDPAGGVLAFEQEFSIVPALGQLTAEGFSVPASSLCFDTSVECQVVVTFAPLATGLFKASLQYSILTNIQYDCIPYEEPDPDNPFYSGTDCFAIFTPEFQFITASLVGEGIEENTSAVPVPAALPLLATGLGALSFAGWSRRRKAA